MPIKNSNEIKRRTMNGAVCQLPIPKSTKVYSKGSIGYNFAYAENKNTIPVSIDNEVRNNFFIINKKGIQ